MAAAISCSGDGLAPPLLSVIFLASDGLVCFFVGSNSVPCLLAVASCVFAVDGRKRPLDTQLD